MTKPEEKPSADVVASFRGLRRHLPTLEGASANLTLTTLLCGFAFAGVILYLGTGHPHATHVVAASLLAAAFIVLLYAALCTTYLVEISGSERRLLTRALYQVESVLSLCLGLALLLASVCVMSFAWSTPLGWVVVPLSALFIARYTWVTIRDMRLHSKALAIDATVMMADISEDALGTDFESFMTDLRSRIIRVKELLAKCAEAEGSPDEETVSELRVLRDELKEKVKALRGAMPKLREVQKDLEEAVKAMRGEE
jgi:hypothetical protein